MHLFQKIYMILILLLFLKIDDESVIKILHSKKDNSNLLINPKKERNNNLFYIQIIEYFIIFVSFILDLLKDFLLIIIRINDR